MADHKALPQAELHEPKGVATMTGGAADLNKVIKCVGDGTSKIDFVYWNEIVGTPTRLVVVNSVDDFPAAVAGVITLADNTTYWLGENFNAGDIEFVLGDFTVLRGIDVESGNLRSDTTGTMFTAVNKNWLIQDLTIRCPNGTVWDVTVDDEFIQLDKVQVSSCQALGTFNSTTGGVMVVQEFIATSIVDGFDFQGSWNILQISLGSDVQFSGTFIDLGTATFNSIGLATLSVFLVSAGSKFLSGLANSGNINAGGIARVTNCVINNSGGGTILTGISPDDVRWRFLFNSGIRDTRPDALTAFAGGAATTTISAAATPVKVVGTYTEDHVSQFTTDASGRATFVGEAQQRIPMDAIVNCKMAAGGGSDLKVWLAVNGVVVGIGRPINGVTTSKPAAGNIMWQHNFTTGDYVEIWVENTTDTNDIIVTDAILRIN